MAYVCLSVALILELSGFGFVYLKSGDCVYRCCAAINALFRKTSLQYYFEKVGSCVSSFFENHNNHFPYTSVFLIPLPLFHFTFFLKIKKLALILVTYDIVLYCCHFVDVLFSK
ncbi:hypothetical protein GLYMA_15G020650v4 [Glycine max]|nr:hypothetical protein GLYMA_15G020650v4 [Glycine max]